MKHTTRYYFLNLLLMISAGRVWANEYQRANFSCEISATREDIRHSATPLPIVGSFSYSTVFYLDQSTHSWEVADFEVNDATFNFPISPYVQTSGVCLATGGSGCEWGVAPAVLFSSNASQTIEMLKYLGSKEIELMDPLSNLVVVPPRNGEKFYQKPNGYMLSWEKRWQAHLPLNVKSGLSFHVQIRCRGVCVYGPNNVPDFCPLVR